MIASRNLCIVRETSLYGGSIFLVSPLAKHVIQPKVIYFNGPTLQDVS